MNAKNELRKQKVQAWIAAHPVETAIIASVILGSALKTAETKASIQSKKAYAKQINQKYK